MINLSLLPPTDNIVPFPTKSNEWYTPAKYIEAARKVMDGRIDLDPASCELANRTVKATRFYSAKDNGLTQEWSGNVWLNPPYGQIAGKSIITLFIKKLMSEYQSTCVRQAILLTTCRTDSAWFKYLWDYPICFASHYVRFRRPDNLPETSHMSGSIFVYLGPNEQTFIDIFSQFGTVARRVSQPKRAVTPLSLWEDKSL